MPSADPDDTARTQIVELMGRYFAAIDDKRLDLSIAESSFAPDGRIVRPNGTSLTGPHEISRGQNESFARFRATHHVITDHVIDFEPDRAHVRANVVAMHLWAPGHGDPNSLNSYFVAGGVLSVDVVRLGDAWRITRLSNRAVWRAGSGYGQMAATGRQEI
jgi:SnoaL-like domain